jgi:hypothetical protein
MSGWLKPNQTRPPPNLSKQHSLAAFFIFKKLLAVL